MADEKMEYARYKMGGQANTHNETVTARQILQEFGGACSVCWDKDGVFEAGRVLKFTDTALSQLRILIMGCVPEKELHKHDSILTYISDAGEGCKTCIENKLIDEITAKLNEAMGTTKEEQ